MSFGVFFLPNLFLKVFFSLPQYNFFLILGNVIYRSSSSGIYDKKNIFTDKSYATRIINSD